MRHRNLARLFTQVASLLHFCSWLSPTAGHEPRTVLLPDSDQFSASPGFGRKHPCNIFPSQAATSSVVTSSQAQDKNGWHEPGLSSGRGNSAEMRHRNLARLFAQETTEMTPFNLVHGRDAVTTLEAMLPNVTDENNLDVAAYLQRAEEARQLARLRIEKQEDKSGHSAKPGLRKCVMTT
ncbi:uncharacterized protein LOC142812975 isoform X2 [Rhipicephalus microplus]|uniref:uncharacterized protein LOC142812975 isoform X2 n=1 Tax=Rhipicephalus microplus TaxID=6941 RepID=UPI003F6A91E1